jgi:uncharacterized membrane protein
MNNMKNFIKEQKSLQPPDNVLEQLQDSVLRDISSQSLHLRKSRWKYYVVIGTIIFGIGLFWISRSSQPPELVEVSELNGQPANIILTEIPFIKTTLIWLY